MAKDLLWSSKTQQHMAAASMLVNHPYLDWCCVYLLNVKCRSLYANRHATIPALDTSSPPSLPTFVPTSTLTSTFSSALPSGSGLTRVQRVKRLHSIKIQDPDDNIDEKSKFTDFSIYTRLINSKVSSLEAADIFEDILAGADEAFATLPLKKQIMLFYDALSHIWTRSLGMCLITS